MIKGPKNIVQFIFALKSQILNGKHDTRNNLVDHQAPLVSRTGIVSLARAPAKYS